MTLDTRVYVHGRVDYRELFVRCNQLIGADEGTRFSDKEGALANEPAQGLPAWLFVYHGEDGPLRAGPEPCDEYCDPDCDRTHPPACWAEVSFDTAYGYRGEDGEGCGDLHAGYVAALGGWLDGKGIRWSWLNEGTGEIHEGREGLAGLGRWQ